VPSVVGTVPEQRGRAVCCQKWVRMLVRSVVLGKQLEVLSRALEMFS
jgi:hypothetical protein